MSFQYVHVGMLVLIWGESKGFSLFILISLSSYRYIKFDRISWRFCYGAVDAHTGESFFLIAGGCNTEWMNAFLEELSQAYPDDYLLLVMDNAIWHKSSTLKIPTNIGFTFIPPYTPEMNPLNKCGKRFVNVDLRIRPFELWKMS
ncbi:degenerate transposase [Streptococcus pneumoniae]|nr:degenerate transposase [Streptococcus pneumoniae]